MNRERVKKYLVLLGIVIFLPIGAGAFLHRAPVVVVTDEAFNELYGKWRVLASLMRMQAELLRPVKQAIIGEEAGADMVSIAVGVAAKSPYCVLFPYRYVEGAERYTESFPGVPTIVLGRRGQTPPKGAAFIQTDALTDLFRAGACAAVLAAAPNTSDSDAASNSRASRGDSNADNASDTRKPSAPSPSPGSAKADDVAGGIAVLQRRTLSSEEKSALTEGVSGEDSKAPLIYLMAGASYAVYQPVSSIILLGPANNFLDQNVKAHVILFSWVNPRATASSVRIVFDDSVWALAVPAIKKRSKGGVIPSKITVLSHDIKDKDIARSLRKATKAKNGAKVEPTSNDS
jgi:hypothetical protein